MSSGLARSGSSATIGGHPNRRALHGVGAWADALDKRVLAMGMVFIVLAIVFQVESGGIFFGPRNLSLLLRQAAGLSVLAAGVSVLMVMGEIDLSIGSAVFFTSVVAAELNVVAGLPAWVAVVGAVGCGCCLGAWQGFWVVRLAVPSFVVTLAGMLMFRGLGELWTNATTIAPLSDSFVAISESFLGSGLSFVLLGACLCATVVMVLRGARLDRQAGISVSSASIGTRLLVAAVAFAFVAWIFAGFLGVPMALVVAAALGIALRFLMTKTAYGRNSYLVGANREASRLAGIDVRRQVFVGFVLMGAIYGIGGALFAARLGGVPPSLGQNPELDAIAAAVIGGTSLQGGVGSVVGAMGGALLLSTIDNGMSLMNFSSFAQLVVKGLVLLVALAADHYATSRRTSNA